MTTTDPAPATIGACPSCRGTCQPNRCRDPRVRARRVLVRHLTHPRPPSFEQLLARILDDLTTVGVLPVRTAQPAPPPMPAPRPALPAAPKVDPAVRVRAARELAGWTQAALARRAGVATITVVRLEAGHGVRPSTLRAVLAALDLPET